MSIGSNIKKYRKANHLTQEDISQALRINRTSLSHYESDRTVPPVEILVQLTRLLRLPSVDYLLLDQPVVAGDTIWLASPGDDYNRSDRLPFDSNLWDLSDLAEQERQLVLGFRMLNKEDQDQLQAFLEKLRETTYLE